MLRQAAMAVSKLQDFGAALGRAYGSAPKRFSIAHTDATPPLDVCYSTPSCRDDLDSKRRSGGHKLAGNSRVVGVLRVHSNAGYVRRNLL